MSLDDHIRNVFEYRRRADVEAQLQAEAAAARAQQQQDARAKQRQRYREERAAQLAQRDYLVYVGRGFGPRQENHSTKVSDWGYKSARTVTIRGSEGSSFQADTPMRYLYNGRSTCDRERIVDGATTVGYYLPEWDISIPVNLSRDICELRVNLEDEARDLDAAKIGNQLHFIYVGRGVGVQQERRHSLVGDWDYKHWSSDGTPARFAFEGRSTSRYEKIVEQGLTVGYYLPEWDLSVSLELVLDVRALRIHGER